MCGLRGAAPGCRGARQTLRARTSQSSSWTSQSARVLRSVCRVPHNRTFRGMRSCNPEPLCPPSILGTLQMKRNARYRRRTRASSCSNCPTTPARPCCGTNCSMPSPFAAASTRTRTHARRSILSCRTMTRTIEGIEGAWVGGPASLLPVLLSDVKPCTIILMRDT